MHELQQAAHTSLALFHASAHLGSSILACVAAFRSSMPVNPCRASSFPKPMRCMPWLPGSWAMPSLGGMLPPLLLLLLLLVVVVVLLVVLVVDPFRALFERAISACAICVSSTGAMCTPQAWCSRATS